MSINILNLIEYKIIYSVMFTENLKTPEKFIATAPYQTCTYHRNDYLNNIHNI